jgi:hypothetical protein
MLKLHYQESNTFLDMNKKVMKDLIQMMNNLKMVKLYLINVNSIGQMMKLLNISKLGKHSIIKLQIKKVKMLRKNRQLIIKNLNLKKLKRRKTKLMEKDLPKKKKRRRRIRKNFKEILY